MMPNLSFKLEEKEDRPTLKIKEELISFEEIASFLFKKCIDDAEENFKNKIIIKKKKKKKKTIINK